MDIANCCCHFVAISRKPYFNCSFRAISPLEKISVGPEIKPSAMYYCVSAHSISLT